jgi:short-subunit dehydrogenase
MKNLTDRVAVVTGAAGGIGRALVMELARAGMHLVLAGRDEQGMERLAREVRVLGRRCSVVRTDVRYAEQLENLLARTIAEQGSCHLLVNNAGILQAAPLFGVELEDWRRVVDINLWGVLYGCRVFGEHFARQAEGHIVNVASWGGLFPAPGMTMYSASKFAVVGFTHQLRWELALKRVGVTLVIPGLVKSPILDRPETRLGHMPTGLIMRAASSAEGLARKVRRAVQSNSGFITYGIDAFLVDAARHMPRWLLDIAGKLFARIVVPLVRNKERVDAACEPSRESSATSVSTQRS